MGNARTVTVENFIDQIAYELFDSDDIQFDHDTEMFEYVKKCVEMIYQILVDCNSELAATGSGTITTVAGTEAYDLSSNSMGDFWQPYKIDADRDGAIYAIDATDSSSNVYPPLHMIEYKERFPYRQAGSTSRGRPTAFYLDSDNIGLLPVPDAAYTITVHKYFPNYVPLTGITSNMPYKNLFNLEIGEGIKLYAKTRNEQNANIEASLMAMFNERAMKLMRGRRKHDLRLIPGV